MTRYTVSQDKNSGLWYAHMIGFPYIPVFGSFSERKRTALQYAKMMDGKIHKLTDEAVDMMLERWKEAVSNEA